MVRLVFRTDSNGTLSGDLSGDFSDSSHWADNSQAQPHPAAPPGPGDRASIGADPGTVISGNGDVGLLEVNNVEFTGNITAHGISDGNPSAFVSGGQTKFSGGASLTAEADVVAGLGTLTFEGGATLTTTTPGGVGGIYVAGGELDLTGAGTTLESNTGLVVGRLFSGTMKVSDGASAHVGDAGNFGVYVGYDSGTVGTLTIETGGTFSGDGFAVVGGLAGSEGTVTVDGAGSSWHQGVSIAVGFFGAGHLDIKNGGHVDAVAVGVGAVSGGQISDVTVDGAGSKLMVTGGPTFGLKVGDNGSTGNLTVKGGEVTAYKVELGGSSGSSGFVAVGGGGTPSHLTVDDNILVGSSGNGDVSITKDGVVEAATAHLGFGASGVGSMSVGADGGDAGGSLTLSGVLSVGWLGQGQVIVRNGGTADVGRVELGHESGSHGTLLVQGGADFGQVTVQQDVVVGGKGVGALSIDGTFAKVTADSVVIGEGEEGGGIQLGNASELNIQNTGKLDVTHNLVVGHAGFGALTVSTASTATVGGNATFGETSDSQASLDVSGSGSLLQVTGDATFGVEAYKVDATVSDNAVAQIMGAFSIGSTGGSTTGAKLSVTSGAQLQTQQTATVGANGEVSVTDAASSWTIGQNLVINQGGVVSVTNGTVSVGGSAETRGTLRNSGGAVNIGTGALGAQTGKITIETSASLASYSGNIEGDIVNAGVIQAFAGSPGSALSVTGAISGTGTISVVGDATIEFDGAVGQDQTLALDSSHQTLKIHQAGAVGFGAVIGDFALGDIIVLTGTGGGVLTFFHTDTNVLDVLDAADNVLATLTLTDLNDPDTFLAYSDGDGGTIVTLSDGTNSDPTMTSDGGGAVALFDLAENTALATTVTATDADLDTLTFALAGGFDADLFSIDAMTGALTFNAAPDYENPQDVGGDNVYDVRVRVFDGHGGYDTQDIQITITNAAGLPVNGTPTNNLLIGTPEEDTLDGGAGNDTLLGLAGPDQLFGGDGIDTASYITSAAGVTVDLDGSISHGGDAEGDVLGGIENLIGSVFADQLTGNAAGNRLEGRFGNDTLDGGGGRDTMIGGVGDDTYHVDQAGDRVTELARQGIDTVITAVDKTTLAANAEILVLLPGVVTGTGNGLGNILVGNAGANTLNGGGGNDILFGGDGGDRLNGGTGFDLASYDGAAAGVTASLAAPGVNTNSAESDVYVGIEGLLGSGFDDTLTGDGKANILVGNVGADSLDGGAGGDTLDGGVALAPGVVIDDGWVDTLRGGAGNDTYGIHASADVVIEDAGGGIDTIASYVAVYSLAGLANVENVSMIGEVVGGSYAATGNELANTLTGGIGNDTLDGGLDVNLTAADGAADWLVGGRGDDTYIVRNTTDKAIELAAQGTDTVHAFVALTLAANVENLEIDDLAGAINGTGNSASNLITGNFAANRLDGGAGNDTIEGGGDADTLIGGAGTDTASYEHGGGVVVSLSVAGAQAGAGGDQLSGFENLTGSDLGGDVLTGTNTANLLRGLGGLDVLTGLGGSDTLDGGLGADLMIGGLGNDTYIVDDAGDVIVETAGAGSGIDTVLSSVDFVLALGSNIENLTLTGSVATHATGNELGNVITGNAVSDTLHGGAGKDFFVFNTALGSGKVDLIDDFSVADDTIRLENAVFTKVGAAGALAGAAFFVGSAAHDASDRIIYDSATGALFYDPDGTGVQEQTQFATLSSGLALTALDLKVI